ncbi:hypothetical protein HanPI659440_Chr03g0099141 [Helianthus annuus]|nr:hypothetical protein HanPI659440_Chr03g0099141 [Helianthus annuus]
MWVKTIDAIHLKKRTIQLIPCRKPLFGYLERYTCTRKGFPVYESVLEIKFGNLSGEWRKQKFLG